MNDQKLTNSQASTVTPITQITSSSDQTTFSQSDKPDFAGENKTSSISDTNQSPITAGYNNNKLIRNYVVASLVVIFIGGGLWLALESQGRVQTNLLGIFTSQAAVATVNGVKITQETYQQSRQQIEASAIQQGADMTDPAVLTEITNQTIQTLINTELLKQEANKRNITVTAEDIQARYDTVVEQVGGQEALNSRLAELALTDAGLRSDITSELLIQALFAEVIDVSTITVTDEEVLEVYNQVNTSQDEKVPFDEVREIIKSNIQLSKEQNQVTDFIESLRTTANIEIKV